MLTIIDKYILKRYLATFTMMLFIFIPIGIVIDVSEKINKMIENDIAFVDIAVYYYHFSIYFTSFLFPILLFLSIIWFTSKLANNTEIIAILSSGISFTRFLRPYIIGATIISLIVLLMGFFLVPKSSQGYNDFRYTYLKGGGREEMRESSDVYRQISDDVFLYVGNFSLSNGTASTFNVEKFKGEKLEFKIKANRIRFNPKDSSYTMFNYSKRTVGEFGDTLESAQKKDTVFNFDFEDLTPTIYVAETLTLGDLYKFIDKERARGSANIDRYMVVLHKKYSLPVSAFILTIIAVALSSMKRRGGMGVNLAIGIGIAFSFVFFDKIFGTLAEKSSIPPLVAVWLPNVLFAFLAIYLLKNAKR